MTSAASETYRTLLLLNRRKHMFCVLNLVMVAVMRFCLKVLTFLLILVKDIFRYILVV